MGSAGETKYGAYTYENLEREPYWPSEKLRISITGAGGFIASHIARRLKSEGHYIIASDWKKNEHMTEDMFCHEFHLVDLRVMDNCLKVTNGVDHVFNLAADMGGMGFIQSNHSVIMYNNTMISFNMLEASRINGVKRSVVLDIVYLGLGLPKFPSIYLVQICFFFFFSFFYNNQNNCIKKIPI
jgi:GDP-D-mannose 3',5'-epimerase